MPEAIRLERPKRGWKCGGDKSLSDVYFYEATHKKDEIKPKKEGGG